MFSMFPQSPRSSHLQPARCTVFAAAAAILLGASTLVPAHAATYQEGAAVTAMPGGQLTVTAKGFRVAVISATDSDGDSLAAQRALVAANIALSHTRGLIAVSDKQVADAVRTASNAKGTLDLRGPNQPRHLINGDRPFGEPEAGDTRLPIDSLDFQSLRKRLQADRAMSVFITRLESTDTSATVRAVVELYSTKDGGLVGRGESTFTSTVGAAPDAAATAPADALIVPAPPSRSAVAPSIDANNRSTRETLRSSAPVANGTAQPIATDAEIAQVKALGGAVYRAVAELNRPIELNGVVVSIPSAYTTRISLGTRRGLRNGARIEYVVNGRPVAYGMITDVGAGEAEATVAPEAAFSDVYVNMQVRNVSNPVRARMGPSVDDKEATKFSRFERSFGIGLTVAGLLYLGGKYLD
jgi:hypothetical protein